VSTLLCPHFRRIETFGDALAPAGVTPRDVEAAISSTASTPIASASNRIWTLTELGLYLIYELADKHDYQNQQLAIHKRTLLVKMIA